MATLRNVAMGGSILARAASVAAPLGLAAFPGVGAMFRVSGAAAAGQVVRADREDRRKREAALRVLLSNLDERLASAQTPEEIEELANSLLPEAPKTSE